MIAEIYSKGNGNRQDGAFSITFTNVSS